jgi:hypothetical protein
MEDRDFLLWLHERLKNHYGEDPGLDWMRRLREVPVAIAAMEERAATVRTDAESMMRRARRLAHHILAQALEGKIEQSLVDERDKLRARAEAAEDALDAINKAIFAAGAPLGSDNYFAIRNLCCNILFPGKPGPTEERPCSPAS